MEEWRVHEATNGLMTFDVLDQVTPDIILLDLMMPEMDGFDVLQRLRESQQWREIPVVIVTAKILEKDELTFLKNGASHILSKSGLSQAQLVARARSAVGLN